jgi:3-hydroxyisobutyrate dehydrogenase-like beta-hydroxyacid dehydrogenase
MGAAIAGRLLDAGHELTVYNRTRFRTARLAERGARVADSPAELAKQCEYIFSCVLDDAAVDNICFGSHGLVGALGPGQVLVEHATFSPTLARRVGSAVAATGAAYLDAPVTGGPEGAAAGTLTAMVGGPREAFDAVREILGHYTGHAEWVGEQGCGLELKLVNQLLVSAHLVAAGEAAAMLHALALPSATAHRVLMSGWAASAMLDRVLPRAAAGDFAGSGATIAGLAEVQRQVADLGQSLGIQFGLFERARQVFDQAARMGLEDCDPASLMAIYLPSAGQIPADAPRRDRSSTSPVCND